MAPVTLSSFDFLFAVRNARRKSVSEITLADMTGPVLRLLVAHMYGGLNFIGRELLPLFLAADKYQVRSVGLIVRAACFSCLCQGPHVCAQVMQFAKTTAGLAQFKVPKTSQTPQTKSHNVSHWHVAGSAKQYESF